MLKFTARDRLRLLGGGGASLLLAGCGGSTATPNLSAETPQTPVTPTPPPTGNTGGVPDGMLRDRFASSFKTGAVLSRNQVDQMDINTTLALSQFNSLTPSYELKPDTIAPTEGVFNLEAADSIVDWAIANGMEVRGHALVWHEATPEYFYDGTPAQVRARLENYVRTVVEHFRGRIQVWDVVNEVVSVDIFSGDAGVGPDRRGRWYEAAGNADYIDWAFRAARDADPNALLFLNEYSTEHPIKGPWMMEILQRLQDRGVPIDGVGHQFHLFQGSDPAELMQAIDTIDNQFMGLIQHVTEMDMDFYDDPGSCWSSQTNCDPDLGPVAPPSMLGRQAEVFRAVFDGLSSRSSVTSVTTWGVTDNESWLNTSPTERYNFPLMFDREGEPKPAFWAVVDPDYVIPTE
ncbi:MAG: endo-1,4-beta-xylanase [Litorimonas sp.]